MFTSQQIFIKEEIDIASDPIDPDSEDDEGMADNADDSGSEDSDASCIIVDNEKSLPSFFFVKMESDELVTSSLISEEGYEKKIAFDGDCDSKALIDESIQVGPTYVRPRVPSCRLQDNYSSGGKQRSAVALPFEQPSPNTRSSVDRWQTEHRVDSGSEPNKETTVRVSCWSATKHDSHMIKHQANSTADEILYPNLTESIIELHRLVSQEEHVDKLKMYNIILKLGLSLQNPYKINYFGVEPNVSDIHGNLLELYKTALRPHIFSEITIIILDLFSFISGNESVNKPPDFEPNWLCIISGKLFKKSQAMRETEYFTKPWDIRLREGIKGVQPVVVDKAANVKKQQIKKVINGLKSSTKTINVVKIINSNEKLDNSSNEATSKPLTNSSESVKRKQARKRLRERKLQWKQLCFKEEGRKGEIKRGKIKKKLDRVKQPARLKGGTMKKVHRAVGKSITSNFVAKSFECLQCSVKFASMYRFKKHECLHKGTRIENNTKSQLNINWGILETVSNAHKTNSKKYSVDNSCFGGNTDHNRYKCDGIRQSKEFEVEEIEEKDLIAGETVLSGSSEISKVLSNNNSDSEGSDCVFETGKRLKIAETCVNCAPMSKIKPLQSECKLFKSEHKTRHCLKRINTDRGETMRIMSEVKGEQIKIRKSQRNGNGNNNESVKRLLKQSPTKRNISKNKNESQTANHSSGRMLCLNQRKTEKNSRILKYKQGKESAIKTIFEKLDTVKSGPDVLFKNGTNLTVGNTNIEVKCSSEFHFQTGKYDGIRQLEEIEGKDIVAGENAFIGPSEMCKVLSNDSDSEGSECVFETGKRLSKVETGKSLQLIHKLSESGNKTGHLIKTNTERRETLKTKRDVKEVQIKIRKSQRIGNNNESGKCPNKQSLNVNRNKNKSQKVNHISARMLFTNQSGAIKSSSILKSEQEKVSTNKTKFETMISVKSGSSELIKNVTNLTLENISSELKSSSKFHFQTDNNTKDELLYGIGTITKSCFDGNADTTIIIDEIERKELIADETVLDGSSEMCKVLSNDTSESEGSECVFETGKRLSKAETDVNCVQVSKMKLLQPDYQLFVSENTTGHSLKRINSGGSRETKREMKGDQIKIRKSLLNGNLNNNKSKRTNKKSSIKLNVSENESQKANHLSVRVFGPNKKKTKIDSKILKSKQEKEIALKTTFEKLSAVKSGSSVLLKNSMNLTLENISGEVNCISEFHFRHVYNAKDNLVYGIETVTANNNKMATNHTRSDIDSDDENKLIINEDINEVIYDKKHTDDIITISD